MTLLSGDPAGAEEAAVDSRPLSHNPAEDLSATVIICCYTEERWQLLTEAIGSVPAGPNTELVIVVDHNPTLFARLNAEPISAQIVENVNERGFSGARNTGIQNASGQIIVFLDDDASGRPGWLGILLASFHDPSVVVVGGSPCPRWESDPPRWHPRSFYWVFGCSWLGLPTEKSEVRNVIGACMATRRTTLIDLDGFRSPLYGDDTEFCIRAARLGSILYQPACQVDHFVSVKRTSLRYFIIRCWKEGRSKAAVTLLVGSRRALSREVRHFPIMAHEWFRSVASGEFQRAAAIVLGTVTTCAGYGWERIALLNRSSRRGLLPRVRA
jgi:GT2 family glycosyltransferase